MNRFTVGTKYFCAHRNTNELRKNEDGGENRCRSSAQGFDCAVRLRRDILAASFEGRVEFFSFDEAYLKRLRERDFPTEQHFVAYFRKLLVIKLRSRLRGSQAVDDIAQETFLRVFKAMSPEGESGSRRGLGHSLTLFVTMCCRSSTGRSDHGAQLDEDTPEPIDHVIDLDGFLVSKETAGAGQEGTRPASRKGPAIAARYLPGRKGERPGLPGIWRGSRLSEGVVASREAQLPRFL